MGGSIASAHLSVMKRDISTEQNVIDPPASRQNAGFLPHEVVDIAVVVDRVLADREGQVRALEFDDASTMVLYGTVSGTITITEPAP